MARDYVADTFRRWGYLQADLDALGRIPPFPHRDLDALQGEEADAWRKIYCSKIGAEFMHMPYPERCDWIAERLEKQAPEFNKRHVLKRILESETFEKFLHTRYVGSKRFSLDGLAVLIPLLDSILDQAAKQGVEVVMLAMAHRGRLNVMHHITHTLAETIIAGFEDIDPKSALGSDDVKYHKGSNGIYTTESGQEIYVDLASNPSHLEAISPVLMGRVRARKERLMDTEGKKVLGILMHGDAAFAGQGIAAEALNYANLNGFEIGGTIHIIINNLIGFTTEPESFQSTRYASDIAKRLYCPIFHVNGESPDDVVRVGRLSQDYRNAFSSDVVIDLIGYRRYGHQEQDDPTITSPVLYQEIKERPLLFETYAEQVGIAEEDILQLEQGAIAILEDGLKKGREMTKAPTWTQPADYWESFVGGYYEESLEVPTTVSREKLEQYAEKLSVMPEGFTIHPKVGRVFEQRQKMGRGERAVDWGMAEALAFASIVDEGMPVRLVGQDARRGTFSHRHAVLHDHENGNEYMPLRTISPDQAQIDVYDSMLSEAAAIGFEYGFSRDYPEALVLWEAQFGDFVNGAQIIIDQFLTAGEDKWQMLSGLVMLLPHGFEGAGPEHSSARLERFLQSAAEDNIQVCNPSTAGQYYHLLRRQALRKWRKPLVVMTPKSMLRAAAASSSLDYLANGAFHCVMGEGKEYLNAERLLICSGKISHELRAARKKLGEKNVSIITIEQLYPLPEKELVSVLKKYTAATSIVWVQEEPANMGALSYIRPHLERLADKKKVTTVRRSASASPATGSPKAHALEQEAIINLAFVNHSR